jgi:hypothetical protein
MAPGAPVTAPPASNNTNNNNNSPRVRKSYSMSKHREGWSKAEETRFMEGFFMWACYLCVLFFVTPKLQSLLL